MRHKLVKLYLLKVLLQLYSPCNETWQEPYFYRKNNQSFLYQPIPPHSESVYFLDDIAISPWADQIVDHHPNADITKGSQWTYENHSLSRGSLYSTFKICVLSILKSLIPRNIEKMTSHHPEHDYTSSVLTAFEKHNEIWLFFCISFSTKTLPLLKTTKDVIISEDNAAFDLAFC